MALLLPQNGVQAISLDDKVFRMRMPPGIRFHSGPIGWFIAFRYGGILIRSDAHPVLADFLGGLAEEVQDLNEVSGDHIALTVKVHCASALDLVVRHAALACVMNNLPFSYKADWELRTPNPVYAR